MQCLLPRRTHKHRSRRGQPTTWTPHLEQLEERWVPTISATGQSVALVEGQSSTVTLASFTDTDPSPPGDYSVTIIWGDDTATTTGTVTQTGANSFSVAGTHTYGDETAANAPFTVNVQIQENNPSGDHDTGSTLSEAAVNEGDAFTPGSISLNTAEGTAFNGTVATFTDSNTANTAFDFTATIDWGDGTTPTTGTVSNNGGNFIINGSHTYAEDGSYSVSVTLADDQPSFLSATATGTATVAESDLFITPVEASIAPTEGQSFTQTLAFFSDPSSASSSDFTASIDWGDGVSSTGTITGSQGDFAVHGTHTYGDEGTFQIQITVTETGITNATVTTSHQADVAEGDQLAPMGTSFTATQGQPFNGAVASFTDTNTVTAATDFSATIDWGDGATSSGTVSGGNGNFTVNGSHVYANVGTYPVAVNVQDDAPGTATTAAQSTATVVQGHVLTGTGVAVCAAEGVPLQGAVVATFTDTNPQPPEAYSATINWEDGAAPAPGTIQAAGGHFQVLGSHTYGSEGSYTILVTVTFNGVPSPAPGEVIHLSTTGNNSITIQSTATAGGFVTQLYRDVLGRLPDSPGLAFWVQMLHSGRVSRETVAAAFWDSSEHRGVEVDQFYQDFLHRGADPAGRAGWVSALLNGADEGQVAIDFLTSAEYTASHADTGSYVAGLYQDILKRGASASELAYWGQIINSGDRSRAAVAFYFLTSEEAYVDAIEDYYRVFLRRTGDAQGVQMWLQMIESGTASPTLVAAGFLGSPEYLDLALALACQGQ
jgi:hypothetical protein